MNADRLLAFYERIADAPDAIVRFRRFILDLAMRGKLVGQDPNDEPASIFLAGGKRCKSQEFRAADAPGWLVYPVGSLLEFKYGKGMKASERLNEGPVPVFGSNGIVGYCETPLTEAPSIIVGRKGSAGALNLCNRPIVDHGRCVLRGGTQLLRSPVSIDWTPGARSWIAWKGH